MPALSVACSLCLSGSRATGIGRLEGGREALLRGLEAMLGLSPPDITRAERIAAYAQALDATTVPVWKASLSADRWGTAEYLVARRDELRLAGWDGSGGTELLTGPAAVEAAFTHSAAARGEADRVLRIAALLSAGRPLPIHEVLLDEPPDDWPRVWQPVLARLRCRAAPASEPQGPPGTTLLALQRDIASELPALQQDGSFAVRTGASIHATVQAIAAAITEAPAKLAQTAIIGWDPTLTALLDAQLRRLGFPTCGAPAAGSAVSVAQVLPLALGLLWKPADPRLLIDLLSLPVSPIPRKAGQRLAKAIAEMPGLGSRAWQRVFTELVDPSADPKGELRERLNTWLEHDRVELGKPVPVKLIDERCAVVAAWASGRSTVEQEQGLRTSLQHVAAAAALLRRVIAVDAVPITHPQLVRLLAAVNAHDVAETPLPEEAGGPLLLPGWHALRVPIERAIWLGVSVQEPGRPRWSTGEIEILAALGLRLDDGSRLAALRRDADRRGLARVTGHLAIAIPPEPPERRPHPFWTAIRTKLPDPTVLTFFEAVDSTQWSAWTTTKGESILAPHQPRRAVWTAPAQLLMDRDLHSFTSLAKRLACPIGWTFEYVAKLHPGPIAHLPDPITLRGTFAHAVLAEALSGPIQPPAAAVAAAKRIFEERIALDAAPLLFPGARGSTEDLRDSVTTAAAVITRALAAAGCDRIETEHAFTNSKAGWALEGSIDILGLGPKNQRVVLDLKLGNLRDRVESLAEGRALQLAIYSATPAVVATGSGYWILNQRLLVTGDADRVPVAAQDSAHCRVILDAPAMETVWNSLAAALQAGEGWLSSGVIPARPLLPDAQRGEGIHLIGRTVRWWPWPFGFNELNGDKPFDRCGLQADTMATAVGQAAVASNLEETRRLLYVGLTRAQRRLILAHPEDSAPWLSAIGSHVDATLGVVPAAATADGVLHDRDDWKTSIRYRRLAALDVRQKPRVPSTSWIAEPVTRAATHPARWVSPSASSPRSTAAVIETIDLGGRLDRVTGDIDRLGTALHAAFAALTALDGQPDAARHAACAASLENAGATAAWPTAKVIAAYDRLGAAIHKRWHGSTCCAEVPICGPRTAGGFWRGAIDLLVERGAKPLAVIDHKSTERTDDLPDYAGQLDAYAEALAADARPELWVHQPYGGLLVRLSVHGT